MELTIKQDEQRLEYLEGIIEKGLQSFYEVGKALLEIRDNQLYEKVRGIASFETYCKERWGLERRHAYRLIDGAKVVDNVSNWTQIPSTESQTRPLTSLTPEQQREVWKEAVETAPEGRITAAHVTRVVKQTIDMEREVDGKNELKKRTYEVSDAMSFAVMAITHLESIRLDDPKRGTALDKVENWIQKNR